MESIDLNQLIPLETEQKNENVTCVGYRRLSSWIRCYIGDDGVHHPLGYSRMTRRIAPKVRSETKGADGSKRSYLLDPLETK